MSPGVKAGCALSAGHALCRTYMKPEGSVITIFSICFNVGDFLLVISGPSLKESLGFKAFGALNSRVRDAQSKF